ncbi:uncharacterized mitochondrial protein AtMg00860-like [Benincasa hispida]|uniref:uncharacterized mitochondrial protein AtMg00860-like n=1 Tax=Benincasa hispida TaxID=102211 RepID=UPI0019024C2B|nr:uncharacterized mitochondrial protein AtMg00860-like [Benincasa hispida]
MAIFSEYLKDSVEIFMDNFSVYGQTYEICLNNLEKILRRCEGTNLVLNWEKCHFMVKKGIVLGHKVSKDGLEVDKVKIESIEKLPPPRNVKTVRSFLGHASFYRRFVKDFSKIARPMSALLEAERTFDFDDQCLNSFKMLKDALITAPVLVALNQTKPFELMCDVSSYAMGAENALAQVRIAIQGIQRPSALEDCNRKAIRSYAFAKIFSRRWPH